MREFKAFFYIFSKSLFSLEYYKDIIKSNLKLTIKYFILLGVFGALLSTITISLRIIPDIKLTFGDMFKQMQKQYPDDLIITFKDSGWSINKEEPYVISFPQELRDEIKAQQEQNEEEYFPKNMIVFDHEGTIGDLDSFNTLALINSKNLLMKQSGGIQTIPLRDLPDNEINKTNLTEFLDSMQIFVSVLPYLLAMLLLLVLLGVNIFVGTIYVFAITGLLWLLGNFLSKRFLFSNLFKISVHTMTYVIVLQVFSEIINFGIDNIYYFILNVLLGSAVMVYLNRETVEEL